MNEKEEKQVALQAAQRVESLIAGQAEAVMAAEAKAQELIQNAVHDSLALSIPEGDPPEFAAKHFWAQLLREVQKADPNTP